MKTGQTLFDVSRFEVKKGNRGSERGELLDKFLERLNPSRVAEGYKPLDHRRIGFMLAHVPTDDLYPFYKDCEKGTNFSKLFWWKLRR